MDSESDNIETIVSRETNEVIKELFDLLKNRYENDLESTKRSEFIFNYVHLMYYKGHKINLNYGGSFVV